MFVISLFCVEMIVCGYGITLIQKGLDVTEMIPKDLPQHEFMKARQKYFSYYHIYIATKSFDYAHNQKKLMEFYDKLSKVNVIFLYRHYFSHNLNDHPMHTF